MAGGMHGKLGPGLTLAERSQLSGLADARAGTHRRHCWVTGPEDDPGPFPGLVLNWQRQDGGTWQAWVIYLVGDVQTAVQAWVPEALLHPATPS